MKARYLERMSYTGHERGVALLVLVTHQPRFTVSGQYQDIKDTAIPDCPNGAH